MLFDRMAPSVTQCPKFVSWREANVKVPPPPTRGGERRGCLWILVEVHSLQVVAFNRTVEKVDQFLANEAKGSKVVGAHSIEELAKKLKKPRRVMVSYFRIFLVEEFAVDQCFCELMLYF